jgi:hypothetical protein
MVGFPKFDARAFLEEEGEGHARMAPKAPKVAKVGATLGILGTLGARNVAKWGDQEEERAAVIQHDGGAPRQWAEAFAILDRSPPPMDVTSDRWRLFLDDCGRFLDDGWYQRAEVLGWGPIDLFGCDRDHEVGPFPRGGLLRALEGAKLIALSQNVAVAATPQGKRGMYRRSEQLNQAHVWTPMS